jgi:hypothetical protein
MSLWYESRIIQHRTAAWSRREAPKQFMGETESIVGTTLELSKAPAGRLSGIFGVRHSRVQQAAVDLDNCRTRRTSEIPLLALGTPVSKCRITEIHWGDPGVDGDTGEHSNGGAECQHLRHLCRQSANHRPRRYRGPPGPAGVRASTASAITTWRCNPALSPIRTERKYS